MSTEARWVEVAPERLAGWCARFAGRHGGSYLASMVDGVLVLEAPDGERAECHPPPGQRDLGQCDVGQCDVGPCDVGPCDVGQRDLGQRDVGHSEAAEPGAGEPGAGQVLVQAFCSAAAASRRLGLLLARRGGFAVGVAEGTTLIDSKVDSRYVQGRTAAGGWSQQRFARRRQNQAKAAAGDATEVCLRLLVPVRGRLDAIVTGGDRQMVEAVLADPRLDALRSLVDARFLAVPDPKLAVLQSAVASARAVRVRLLPG